MKRVRRLRICVGQVFNLPVWVRGWQVGNLPYIASLLVLLSASLVWAQDAPQSGAATTRRKGTITGRVVADDGQPLPNVRVSVFTVGKSEDGTNSSSQTDAEGNFTADGLPPATYRIRASSSAYVLLEGSNPPEPKHYRLGDSTTLTLTKGGVITGRLTDATGEPLIEMGVAALRIRHLDGSKVRAEQGGRYTRLTDDRGHYRLYGLEPGIYIMQANASAYYYRGGDPHLGEKPVYYPSTSRDGAQEITVNAGEEVRGIDIRYRGEPGYRLSGNVFGGASPAGAKSLGSVSLSLLTYPARQLVSSTWVGENTPERKFVFFGLADGEYLLKAEGRFGEKEKLEYLQAAPRRITIKGNDVANIRLQLVPLSSVEGVITLATLAEKDRPQDAKPVRPSGLAELLLSLRAEDPRVEEEEGNWQERARKAPNDKGEITYISLPAARYRLTAQLPSEDWYIKAISLPAPAAEAKPAKPTAPVTVDVGKQGLQLKAGDKLKGLTVTLAEGAAGVSGRVVAESSKAPAIRLRVHLVPAEKDAADVVLRYYEVLAQADGSFTFAHLAPGQYWLLAQAATNAAKPLAWDSDARTKLHQSASRANNTLALTPCQRVKDHTLVFRDTIGK